MFDVNRGQDTVQRPVAEAPVEAGLPTLRGNRMTAGTGVTGQMRYEMDTPEIRRGMTTHEARAQLAQIYD